MKKKIWILIVTVVLLLAVLFIPYSRLEYKDGGTKVYTALTYKIVKWKRLGNADDEMYQKTKVYFFPDSRKSYDELWSMEDEETKKTFVATIIEMNGSTVIVTPEAGSSELRSGDKITFDTGKLENIGAVVGSVVEITYNGDIMESYPAQIFAQSWKLAGDNRTSKYTENWLDKTTAEKCENDILGAMIITRIYSNCFFAKTVVPRPYEIKLNGTLSDEWCVGDRIVCTYENTYCDDKTFRIEADMLTIEASDWAPDAWTDAKPVIYLYPEKETEITVRLTLDGELTCTYPAYNGGWKVTARPDGTLIDERGQTYNYLYWEGETYAKFDLSKGFCVKGEDTALFLEYALERLGLTRREANEFIVYWLPLMEQNPYNIISFQSDIYTDSAQLEIDPAPDTMIRVFMAWKPSNESVELPEQDLKSPERIGFTVVEWGGTCID